MQISFYPNLQNNKQQRPAFKAFNQGFYDAAKANADVVRNSYYFQVLSGEFPIDDYIDTIPKIQEHYFPKFQKGLQSLLDWANKFKVSKK